LAFSAFQSDFFSVNQCSYFQILYVVQIGDLSF